MRRIVLTDGSGRWFDEDKAEAFDEERWFDGRNQISRATGDQFEHERLYRTASGQWVLNAWSDWQGSSRTATKHDACAAEYAALNLDAAPGG